MNSDRMFELAQALAVAKSRQDVPAALTVLHDDMLLETPAFGTSARGLAENAKVLTPVLHVVPGLQCRAAKATPPMTIRSSAGARVQMTMTGDRFGVAPNGRRAELPVFIQFAFKDDRIARERFFFDLSELCAQSGVSTDAVRHKIFGDAAARQQAAE